MPVSATGHPEFSGLVSPGRARRQPRRWVASAIALALMAALQSSHAVPVVAHWTLTDMGSLGGWGASVSGINDIGQVVGNRWDATGSQGFLYSRSGGTALLGSDTAAWGINNQGQVAGQSAGSQAAVWRNGVWTTVNTLGLASSALTGINDAGQVVGTARSSLGTDFSFSGAVSSIAYLPAGVRATAINSAGWLAGTVTSGAAGPHPFLLRNGAMTELANLGGNSGYGQGINDTGQLTGYSTTNDGVQHAFLYSGNSLRDLGSLAGANHSSYGFAINNAGLVVGASDTLEGQTRAFMATEGGMLDLNALNGVAGAGLTLYSAAAVNNSGQIAGRSFKVLGEMDAFLLTLDTTVWEASSNGSFDSGAGWSYGIGPNLNTAVFIDPTRSLTVTGPLGQAVVRQLTVGGDGTGNNGIATLNLQGGTLSVLGNAGAYTTVSRQGVLLGEGTLTGAVVNLGTVNSSNLNLPQGLNNQGLVTGNGWLRTNLVNAASGTLQLAAGQSLSLVGGAHSNAGLIDVTAGGSLQVSGNLNNRDGGRLHVNGGSASFDAPLVNESGGRLQLSQATLSFGRGLVNSGQTLFSFGTSEVFGAVTTTAGGKLILSGNSNTTFYDGLDVQTGGELRVSAGSSAVFFGQVKQRTGALFTGTGTKFYEGGLSVGASPGLGLDGGDVNLGAGNVFLAEIGGTAACTDACMASDAVKNSSFDKYVVAGHLGLGGTLRLVSWNGFVAQAGQRFDLLDWGQVSGSFASIDSSGFTLAAGTVLDTSHLALDGSISVTAVPEPGSWALMVGGLVWLARRRRSIRPA